MDILAFPIINVFVGLKNIIAMQLSSYYLEAYKLAAWHQADVSVKTPLWIMQQKISCLWFST